MRSTSARANPDARGAESDTHGGRPGARESNTDAARIGDGRSAAEGDALGLDEDVLGLDGHASSLDGDTWTRDAPFPEPDPLLPAGDDDAYGPDADASETDAHTLRSEVLITASAVVAIEIAVSTYANEAVANDRDGDGLATDTVGGEPDREALASDAAAAG